MAAVDSFLQAATASGHSAVAVSAVDRAVGGVSASAAVQATQPGVGVHHPDRLCGEPPLALEDGLHGIVDLASIGALDDVLHHALLDEVGHCLWALLWYLGTHIQKSDATQLHRIVHVLYILFIT